MSDLSDLTPRDLMALRDEPPRAGRLATEARASRTGDEVWIFEQAVSKTPERFAAEVRHGERIEQLEQWPDPDSLAPEVHLTLRVGPDEAESYAEYLCQVGAATTAPATVAPWCVEAAGTHRLWSIAAARIALGGETRVEARHDLIGLRMAQLALAFGADALTGPIEADRLLPLAGVSRPTENTRAGLAALVEQAGLTPRNTP